MAPSKTDCNNNKGNSENGRNGDDESAAKKEPVRNETEDFDVSDCFTNDFDDVNGGRMIASKKNGSFVNIEASQEMPASGGAQKEEPAAIEPKESKPTKKMLDASIVIDLSDDDEVAGGDSQESLDSRFKRTMAQAALTTKKEADCENEDPDIVQLKKDLYQSNGEIDYDIDLGEDEKPVVKIEAEPKVEPKKEELPMVVIKVEPPTREKQSLLKIKTAPIQTIDLTSSDEEVELPKKEEPDVQAASPDSKSRMTHSRKAKNSASNTSVCSEYVVVKAEQDKLKIRRKKRKSKKRSKRRESSSESGIDLRKRSKSTDIVANSEETKPAPDQKDVEPKVKSPAKPQSPNRRRSNESDYVKSTITKELATPADTSDQKAEEEETGPFVNTDIALEDLLNDFLEDETVPQNPSQVLFPTVATEEDKLLLNSPLIDCERILLDELNNILKDDKLPHPDKLEEPPEQPLFTYTIYEPNSAAATPLNITVNVKPPSDQKPSSPTKAPTPRFRIVYGRSKYPPPPPPPKKRPGRPARAVPEPPPKPSKSKRYESDEEYIPSFARTRRYPLRPRRARRRAPRARLVAPAPNGYFLTELQVQPEPDPEEEEEEELPTAAACQSPLAASDGVYMNMPSLAEAEQAANGTAPDFKMSDSKEPAVEVERNDDGDRKEGDGSDGYGITEEQEKTLLAGEEDDNLDLDVIECFVDDFDSDMEEEFRRKDAKKVEKKANDGKGKADEVKGGDTVEVLEFVRIVHNADESGSTTEEPLEGFEEEVAAPVEEAEDDDEDVIQIVEESVEDLLGDGKVEEPLEASVHVSDETENERILSKPLVKQVVMDMSGEECDKEDESTGQVVGEGSQKGDEDDRVETPNASQDDSDAEQPLVIAVSVEANVGAMSGRHQEDPDVLQLKLDLQQNLGKMDYEPDDEERLERRIQIKEEPMSPVRDRLERILLDVEDIPTIVLSSDDDLSEQVVQEKKPKKAKKKSKKKSKQRSKSECSEIEAAPIDVEESLPAVISTTSSKSLLSNDCMFMDEELLKTGFRMELRKRKSATRLEEGVTSPPSRKRRNPTRKSSDCRSSIGQSKSRGSIASTVSSSMSEYNVPADIPPKKTPSQKSTSRPVSTALKMKFNSLFDDCDKSEEVVPVSILVDGMPLFEKVSKKHVTVPVAPPAPHRQTMLIDALPRVGVASPAVKPGPSKSSGQKSKIEQEIMHSLENDLAMSSDDEVAPLRQKLGSVKGRSPAPTEKRKRGRAPKHHIEDYFGSSPTRDKKDGAPATETASKKPQVKRRKKRSHISSGSSEDETTATESTSLAGTISTITAREGDEEQLPVAPEEVAPPKTDEMRVVLSPLTDAKIEKLSKCNTPKKPRALSKASQTELQGLSWRIELDQIDFHSEYFEKLYQLIVNGRELRNNLRPSNNNNNNKFEGVVLVGRDAVLPPTPPERSPQRPVGNGRARSAIEQLLFQRADEIEFESSAPVDPAARERMERSVRSNFRIPKIAKQPSRSPQDVTSSTQHDNEQQQQHYQDNETRRSSSSGYSNDRNVAPEARHHITVGSPLRNQNRPEVAAPAIDPQPAARPVPIMRRTIRNDNVQPPAPPQPIVAPPTPAQPQPVENGFATYGPPEQVPPPQQQYRAGNMFQPPQQQQPQLGGYTASGQELDVKPNLSALMNPANMLGTAMMNPSRFFDSLSMVYQVTMMQMMQQHMPFPAMNPAGQAPFPGPSVAPTAANMPPQPIPAQMMPRPQPTPSSSAGPRFAPDPVQSDEVSDQICQIFGCIDHLKGRCIKNPCQYSHTLPNESSLLQMLLGSAQDVVMTTYQFIVGQDSLFLRYFPVYTEVMGRRNMRHQLVDAVPHCEQSKRAFSHYRFIVDGLTINGTLTRSKAVQLVLEKHRKINFDQINVLITLMLDTGDDIPQFLQWFEQFAQVQDYHYEIPSINRLIKFCVRSSRSVDVAKLTYRLVLSVAPGKEPFVDTDALSEFVEQLMKSKLGLDLEKIRLKYRENELSGSARR